MKKKQGCAQQGRYPASGAPKYPPLPQKAQDEAPEALSLWLCLVLSCLVSLLFCARSSHTSLRRLSCCSHTFRCIVFLSLFLSAHVSLCFDILYVCFGMFHMWWYVTGCCFDVLFLGFEFCGKIWRLPTSGWCWLVGLFDCLFV